MNEIVNKFLSTGDKFKPEMHLKQPGFTYSVVDHLLKQKKNSKIQRNRRYKAFNTTKNPKYEGYQRGLASMVCKFFDKKSSAGNGIANKKTKQNIQLAEELQKSIIRNI